jgi:hypothetical protein
MIDYFIIPNAINVPNGVFSADQRIEHLLETYNSIRSRFPSGIIIHIESGLLLTESQRDWLISHADHLIDLSEDDYMQSIYTKRYDNSTCKNVCESYSWQQVHRAGIRFEDSDRLAKVSGRYQITDRFKMSHHPGKITLAGPYDCNWPDSFSDIKKYFMTAGVVWDGSCHDILMSALKESHAEILEHLSLRDGRYCDIEHALYKHLPSEITNQAADNAIGVFGHTSKDGSAIKI